MTYDLSNLSDQALSELLLDYVRGTAPEDAKAAIDMRAATDQTIADEIAYLQGLKHAISPLKQDAAPDELGWKRLSNAINAERAPMAANDNAPFWKYAAAALAVVAALQTAFLFQSPQSSEEPTYVTASANDETIFGLNVIFQPTATADELTSVLKDVKGEIIAGPSALGLYTIAFDDAAARDAALTVLTRKTDIVESVSAK
jgi:anti-sigma-K factor RskA